MKQAIVVAVLCSAGARAEAPVAAEGRAEQAKRRVAAAQVAIDKQREVIAAWAAAPELVAAVTEQNAAGPLPGMDNAKWAALSPTDPTVVRLQENAAGKFLRAKLAADPKLYAEAFLNAAKGEKVALAAKTTSYLHRGKPKFDVAFDTGKPWQGKPEFDESSKSYSVQLAAPVLDGGRPIGVLVVGLALVALEAPAH